MINELGNSIFVLHIVFQMVYNYYQELKRKYRSTHGFDPFGFFSRKTE